MFSVTLVSAKVMHHFTSVPVESLAWVKTNSKIAQRSKIMVSGSPSKVVREALRSAAFQKECFFL